MAEPAADVGPRMSQISLLAHDAPRRVLAVAQLDGSTRYTRRPSDSPLSSRRPRSVKPIGEPARSSRVAHEA